MPSFPRFLSYLKEMTYKEYVRLSRLSNREDIFRWFETRFSIMAETHELLASQRAMRSDGARVAMVKNA